jgi:ABC-2 type transport system ATP-binding protein
VAAIVADELGKRYGRAVVVDRVSFTIHRGELVGFLGPNGAGKTTTLRMLAGLIHPSSGAASILGRAVPGPSLLNVGTMIEEPSFYPWMSGIDNLRHAALLHGGIASERVHEVLAFVGLTGAEHKHVAAYSQGMRQRLGLARALLNAPQVLLLDEPTNGLDPVGIAEFRENLRGVAAAGVAVLVSSHLLAEIEKLADRILVIDQGRLRYDGPMRALLERLDDDAVTFLLRATDHGALRERLQALALTAHDDGDAIRVRVARTAADYLLSELARGGVLVTEARRRVDDLEEAYLRLLHETPAAMRGWT